jgi:hypothetical protein
MKEPLILKLSNFLKKYHIKHTLNYKLKDNILQIYIPKNKIAINVVLFKHACTAQTDDVRINERLTSLCEKCNIRLLTIFEHELLDIVKRKIWLSIIKNSLGLSSSIYARKCKIVIPTKEQCKEFLHQNHLQDYYPYSHAYALTFNNEIVSLMTFGKARFNEGYELLRFCSKRKVHVVGGASRLFKQFNTTEQIVSYANRRFSSGNLYDKLGLVKQQYSCPNYWYFNTDKILHNRIKFQKHKLSKLLPIYKEELTESKNMYLNNYKKLYDCGNITYIQPAKGKIKSQRICNENSKLTDFSHNYVYILYDTRIKNTVQLTTSLGNITLKYEPFYVGKGRQSRPLEHLHESIKKWKTSNNKYNKHKYYKIRKIYKTHPFKWHEIQLECEDQALAFEIELIKLIGRQDKQLGPLVNLTDGGNGTSGSMGNKGHIVSEATKQLISIARTGKKFNEQHCENLAKAVNTRIQQNPDKFKEQCKLGGSNNKGRSKSNQHKRNISAALTGIKKSKQLCKELSITVKLSKTYIFAIKPPNTKKWRICNSIGNYVKQLNLDLDASTLSALASKKCSYYKGYKVKRINIKNKIMPNSKLGKKLPPILEKLAHLPKHYTYPDYIKKI